MPSMPCSMAIRVSSAVAMPLRMNGILNFLRSRATSAQEKRAWKLSLCGARARGRDVALGEVALAPAVVVEIDGEAERDVAVGDGALDVVLDPGRVAADVELEDLGVIVAGRHRLEARRALRAQHVQDAEARGRPRRRGAARCHHVLQRADGRQDHGQAQLLAEHLGARVDLLDVAQDARAEGQRVEGDAVAHVGRLRLGAAHQVVPGPARDVAPGRRKELVQDGVLQLLLHSATPRVLHALPRPRGPRRTIPNRRAERSWGQAL